MIRHRRLIMRFSDLLSDLKPTIKTLRQLRHPRPRSDRVQHLDEAEVNFPSPALVEFREPEDGARRGWSMPTV